MKADESPWSLLAPVAASISNFVSLPLVVVDSDHRIRLVNPAMEALLGGERSALIGQTFERACASDEPEAGVRENMEEAFAGKRCFGQTFTAMPSGSVLSLSWECTLVPGPVPALVGVVRSWQERHEVDSPLFADDMQYEISTTEPDLGVIRDVRSQNPEAQKLVGKRCYLAIGRRETVCPECPALGVRKTKLAIVSQPYSKDCFKIVTVEKTYARTSRIGSRTISSTLLDGLLSARVDNIASRRNLSPRERQVLLALVDGRSKDEIAQELGITPRTVKFHQANVLSKLGADSRADLMRLFF